MSGRASLFGSEVIQLLIPHRRPLMMVDRIESFEPGERARLRAWRQISANEEVFAGHFPDLHIWPSVYTIEGLGQSCLLLSILEALDPQALDALRALELGYRMQGGYRPRTADAATAAIARLGPPGQRIGLAAAVDVRFLAPVFAGQRLIYQVTRTHAVERMTRFDVEAEVDGRPVARGTMTGRGGVVVPGGAGEVE